MTKHEAHTQEPWSVEDRGANCMFVVADVDVSASATQEQRDYYRSIATITQRDPHPRLGGGIDREVTIANARRIVACVNACAGISTEQLEAAGTIAVECQDEAQAELLKATEQRDNLPAALENILAITYDSRGVAGYHLNGDIAEWDSFQEIAEAEAVIAEAKGGSK